MAAPNKTLNQLTQPYLQDVYCFLPIGKIVELTKVRPINSSGKDKLKQLILNAGWSADSVLKVCAPKSADHIHWGLSEKTQYEEKQLEFAWKDLKSNDERKDANDKVG